MDNGYHYNVIKSMKAFNNKVYYCNPCMVGWRTEGDHFCKNACNMCHLSSCEFEKAYQCFYCKKKCESLKCLNTHEESYCLIINKCFQCGALKRKNHVCGFSQKWCSNCRRTVNMDHECYILCEDEKKEKETKFNGYICFDYEAYQDDDEGNHVPNLVIAKKICKGCLDKEKTCKSKCETRIFYNNNDFCDWIFEQEHYIAIAHNLKGYDGCFIQQYILRSYVPIYALPINIVDGSKLLMIKSTKLKFID